MNELNGLINRWNGWNWKKLEGWQRLHGLQGWYRSHGWYGWYGW